jgi:DNA invertase Pin-like site-specific DNA recombinase
MKRAMIYARVSTEMQEEKDSLKYQIEKCRDYCDLHSYKITKEISDVESGGNDDRVGFLELKREVELKSFDVLIVYESSRVSRKMITMVNFVLRLQEKDIKFISISQPELNTTTPTGMLFFQIQASLAEYERKQIASRTKSSNYQRAKNGKWLGGTVPLGYKNIDKKLIIDDEEADLVKEIFDYYLMCGSLRSTSKKFGRHFQSIRWILTNEIYIGFKKWGQKEKNIMTGKVKINKTYDLFNGEHDSIISMDTFESVQRIIQMNKDKKIKNSTSKAIFTGILRCPCGGKLYNATTKRKWKHENRYTIYHYYKCFSCRKNYPREEVERVLLEKIYNLPEMKDLNDTEIDTSLYHERITKLNKTLDKLTKKRNRTLNLYTNELINESELNSLLSSINSEIELCKKQIEENQKLIDSEKSKKIKDDNIDLFREVMKNLDIEDRDEAKKIMRLLFNKIELKDFVKQDYDFYLNF